MQLFEGSGLIVLFEAGGWVSYPLLLCSVVGLAIIIERSFYYISYTTLSTVEVQRFVVVNQEKEFDRALCNQIARRGQQGRIIALAMNPENNKNADVLLWHMQLMDNELSRFLSVLALVSVISPMLGLLGTVVGMVDVFSTLAQTNEPKALAGGIGQALITTVFGLCLAIPFSVVHHFFVVQAQKKMEALQGLLLQFTSK